MKNLQTTTLKVAGLLIAGLLMAACSVPAILQQNQAGQTQGTTGQNPLASSVAQTTPGAQQNPPGVTGNQATGPRAIATALPTRVVTSSTSIAVDGAFSLTQPLLMAAFESSGKVAAVNVTVGQEVKKGEVLATLESTDLNTALQKAQEALTLQEAQVAKSLAPATQADLDNAKAALSSAYAAYNELKQGPSAHTVEQALISWNQAKNSLYSSQLNRDKTCRIDFNMSQEAIKAAKADKTNPECQRADRSVQSAEFSERTAYQNYVDAQAPATQNALTKAWASVVQAQSSLDTLQNGASDAQKKVYDLQIEQAKVTVQRAQRDLATAQLVSPCDCVVEAVDLVPGTSSSGSIDLLDLSHLQFVTSNLSEQDVVKLQAGQTVTLRLKAFTQTFNGKVSAILPMSSGSLGTSALFTALIDVESGGAALRPGMTGQAEIKLQ